MINEPALPYRTANEAAIRTALVAAFIANRNFVAIANPTLAQSAAHLKAVSTQINQIIRLLGQQFDGTN